MNPQQLGDSMDVYCRVLSRIVARQHLLTMRLETWPLVPVKLILKPKTAHPHSQVSPECVCAVHVCKERRSRPLNKVLELCPLRRSHRHDQAMQNRSRATFHSIQVHAIDVAPRWGAYIFILPWMAVIRSKCACTCGSVAVSAAFRSAFCAAPSARFTMSRTY